MTTKAAINKVWGRPIAFHNTPIGNRQINVYIDKGILIGVIQAVGASGKARILAQRNHLNEQGKWEAPTVEKVYASELEAAQEVAKVYLMRVEGYNGDGNKR